MEVPSHIKYRRETDAGLVYDHENYGYEDASLLTVDERVVDVLEAVDGGTTERSDLEDQFAPETLAVLEDRGFLASDA